MGWQCPHSRQKNGALGKGSQSFIWLVYGSQTDGRRSEYETFDHGPDKKCCWLFISRYCHKGAIGYGDCTGTVYVSLQGCPPGPHPSIVHDIDYDEPPGTRSCRPVVWVWVFV